LTREREIRSLIKASSDIHCGNLIVITLDYEGKEEFEGKVISFCSSLEMAVEIKSPDL